MANDAIFVFGILLCCFFCVKATPSPWATNPRAGEGLSVRARSRYLSDVSLPSSKHRISVQFYETGMLQLSSLPCGTNAGFLRLSLNTFAVNNDGGGQKGKGEMKCNELSRASDVCIISAVETLFKSHHNYNHPESR